ncbi:MAG: alcohol dehydrogenase catalytic domain-containing protein [Alicyclobacillus sp.]|nr:alcohol dehydrogenase catalytic domain-containing protein [Alicyclobacillus sp.]
MLAAVCGADGRVRLERVPVPLPGPGEALVRVDACGVCGSDRSFVAGATRPPGVALPVVLGHEIAGRVAAFGPDTDGGRLEPGDAVLVYPFIGCGNCRACARGQGHLCLQQRIVGYHRPGGYAEYVTVPVENLLASPATLSPAYAALLVDAFATPYHALAQAHAAPGDRLLVMGSGGLGMAAVLMRDLWQLEAVGVVSSHEQALELARALGADEGFLQTSDSDRNLARVLRRWSQGGVDLVLDTRGTAQSVAFALGAVRPGGAVAVVGLSPDALPDVALAGFARRGVRLIGSFGSSRWDVAKLVDWASGDGRGALERLQIHKIPLDALPDRLNPAGGAASERTGSPWTAPMAAYARLVVTPGSP